VRGEVQLFPRAQVRVVLVDVQGNLSEF